MKLFLLLYIVLTISILIGQEPPAYFENSRDFVDMHDYSIICYPIISADSVPCAVRTAHLWIKSASTWMVSSYAAAWCVCPCIFTSTNEIYLHSHNSFLYIFHKTMYNKTILFSFCDIRNNQGGGKWNQPRPGASDDYTCTLKWWESQSPELLESNRFERIWFYQLS